MIKVVKNFLVSAGVVSAALLVGFSAKAIIMIDPDAIPACTADDWTCTAWSECKQHPNALGHEYSTRTCTPTKNCLDTNHTTPSTETMPEDPGDCDVPSADKYSPACTADQWTCTAWQPCMTGLCSNQSSDTCYASSRTCTPTVGCYDTNTTKPTTSYMNSSSCSPVSDKYSPVQPAQNPSKPACTADQWTCTAWTDCVDAGEETKESTRICAPTADCDPNSATKPSQKSADCKVKADKYSQSPATGADTSRMIIINSNVANTDDLWPSASINQDKWLFLGLMYKTGKCVSNTLIKTADSAAVYYCGNDEKRYVFPNEKTYYSWYTNFNSVTVISAAAMASIPIGGNVTYRPGMRMIKVTSSPTVYAVGQGGVLHAITSEAVAASLYGADWNTKIDDISDAFFVNYTTGGNLNFK